jgi:hypothetical protein
VIAALVLAVTAGLFAPSAASGVLGVEPLDALARPVATVLMRQLAAAHYVRPLAIDGDPSAADCRAKPYAAVAQIETTVVPGTSSWNYDAALLLVDCAGWNVDEWHESLTLPHPPTRDDGEKLGMNLALRFNVWTRMQPKLAASLFEHGLAYDPASAKPTYLYTLFKTSDGNMRVFARPGGPAWDAGLRTNDVVQKIDGRWWWEYGTYQAQQRAYDGSPHAFDVKRDNRDLHIVLGEPFTP